MICAAVAGGCSENERQTYDPNMHDVYFDIVNDTRDSLFISLLTADDVSTHTIQINLMGNALSAPERFGVEAVTEKSTAREGVHFEKLPEYFEFPAGEFSFKMPITLIKTDPLLESQEVVLTLRLVSVADMGVAFKDQAELRVKYSNMLRIPEGDGYYGDMTAFQALFGEYSRTKHTMIIELTGHDFWDGDYGNYGGAYGLIWEKPYYTPYARRLYRIITEGTYYDENGKLMTGWSVP